MRVIWELQGVKIGGCTVRVAATAQSPAAIVASNSTVDELASCITTCDKLCTMWHDHMQYLLSGAMLRTRHAR